MTRSERAHGTRRTGRDARTPRMDAARTPDATHMLEAARTPRRTTHPDASRTRTRHAHLPVHAAGATCEPTRAGSHRRTGRRGVTSCVGLRASGPSTPTTRRRAEARQLAKQEACPLLHQTTSGLLCDPQKRKQPRREDATTYQYQA